MEKEIWRPVKNYEGLYEVSNCGNVRRLDCIIIDTKGRTYLHKGRIMKPTKNKYGYYYLPLSKKGNRKLCKVHRLVADAFIPNPENFPIINHRDENPSNNYVENLEWCDAKYNTNYGTAIQRRAEKRSRTVLQISKEYNEVIAEYSSLAEVGRQTVFDFSTISKCCRGEIKTAYGYKWKFKKE